MESAKKLVEKIDSDMGGTEMVKPIKWCLDGSVIPKYPKQVHDH